MCKGGFEADDDEKVRIMYNREDCLSPCGLALKASFLKEYEYSRVHWRLSQLTQHTLLSSYPLPSSLFLVDD